MTEVITLKKIAEAYKETPEGLKVSETRKILDWVNDYITTALVDGKAVRIPGIGTIVRKDRPAREYTVPGGEKVTSAPCFGFKLKSKTYKL